MAKRDFGAEIVAGLKEFRDNPKKLKRYEFAPADVKAIRHKFGMSQQQFADFLMISVRTLQKWEQKPASPFRLFLLKQHFTSQTCPIKSSNW